MGWCQKAFVLGIAVLVAAAPTQTIAPEENGNTLLSPTTMNSESSKINSASTSSTITGPVSTGSAEIQELKSESVADISSSQQLQSSTNLLEIPPPVAMTITKNAWRANVVPKKSDITLVIQSDKGRLGRLKSLANSWKGPISYGLLIHEQDRQEVTEYLHKNPDITEYATIHLCVSEEKVNDLYPINKMRNVGIRGVETEWLYLIDIDENPVGSMEKHLGILEKAITEVGEVRKPAFIVTSWQWSSERLNPVPHDKTELKALFSRGSVGVKIPSFPLAYTPPSLSLGDWLERDGVQRIRFDDEYEPYYIARKSQLPEFDSRFVGWGRNKAFQTLTMASEDFVFFTLPEVFNFSDEEAKIKGGKIADVGFFEKAFRELGQKHGCSSCTESECVKNCPNMFQITNK